MISGFYHLQNIIYSHQRVKLYNLYRILIKENIQCFAVKVDCIFINYEALDDIKKTFINSLLSKTIGGLKLEHKKKIKE